MSCSSSKSNEGIGKETRKRNKKRKGKKRERKDEQTREEDECPRLSLVQCRPKNQKKEKGQRKNAVLPASRSLPTCPTLFLLLNTTWYSGNRRCCPLPSEYKQTGREKKAPTSTKRKAAKQTESQTSLTRISTAALGIERLPRQSTCLDGRLGRCEPKFCLEGYIDPSSTFTSFPTLLLNPTAQTVFSASLYYTLSRVFDQGHFSTQLALFICPVPSHLSWQLRSCTPPTHHRSFLPFLYTFVTCLSLPSYLFFWPPILQPTSIMPSSSSSFSGSSKKGSMSAWQEKLYGK